MELKRAAPPVSDINVTPMVDVMLVVLIIFMVITPMLSKTVSVDKYRARNAVAMSDADKEDAVEVAVTRDGSCFLSPGTIKVQPEDLAPKVKDMLANRPVKTVYISADTRAKYGRVEDVVDNLRAGGVDDIGLLTDQVPQAVENEKKPEGGSGGGL
jgi:biopolymer transport protein ExbD/biopolymer transport protein TolR